MSSEPASKKARTEPTYELLYHAGIPGRGEFIRLAFEAAGVPYNDVGNGPKGKSVYSFVDPSKTESGDDNPPLFALPILRVSGAGPEGKTLVIGQTPNILSYLGPKLGLVPEGDDGVGALYVQQLALTALDLNNEVHDTHHPIAVMKYYEDQREQALLKAADVRENRLPKFFSYFQRALQHNKGAGNGKYLVGDKLTYADTTVWQILDGLYFAFPKEMAARKEEYPDLLQDFYESVKGETEIKSYLESKRRLPYGDGVFRRYPELDRQ